ncbi:hypothetical protein Tco_0903502 [Tanacetum coccineum]
MVLDRWIKIRLTRIASVAIRGLVCYASFVSVSSTKIHPLVLLSFQRVILHMGLANRLGSTLPLPSPPTHTSPTYTKAPLGYKAAMIWSGAASPSTRHPLEIPSPPLLLPSTTPAAAARQPGLDVATVDATPVRPMSRAVGYRIEDVWDDMVGDIEGRAPTTLEDLSQRVIDLAATLARDTHEMAVHAELLAYRAEGHDRTREPEPARDPEPQDRPADAGSSC